MAGVEVVHVHKTGVVYKSAAVSPAFDECRSARQRAQSNAVAENRIVGSESIFSRRRLSTIRAY